ncbi:MAG: biotin-dependent carboxyltransferase family protein [Bacillota bacterium]|nr:biotin-dependent carboxyltransferase family protein [Bacillota bacterium]
MPDLAVMQPGMFTTVQDLGRRGLQQYGVPVSGPMDEYSLRAANNLVLNGDTAAVLEATLMGPTLKCNSTAVVAVTGAWAPVTVNGLPVPMWQTLLMKCGDVLTVGVSVSGTRVYIAVAGGFDVPVVMGSRSTFVRGSIGGVEGRIIRSGDVLPVGVPTAPLTEIMGNYVPRALHARLPRGVTPIRVILGPQDDCFPEDALYIFSRAEYTVSNESDRMGFRLEGPKLAHRDKADIVSDGIAPGSIQVPGHGLPIVMLADRQTTGGYTKIATVISVDLALMGQMKPQDKLRFVAVSPDEAVRALREQELVLRSLPCKSISARKFSIRIGSESITAEIREVVEEV